MDVDNITLTDLIDARTLQNIQDAFSGATGMAALTVDLNGPVTELSNPTEFCMDLTRKSKIGAERCNQCDLKGGEEAGKTGRPSVYYCHGGLMDFAAPILIENRQIGSLIGGQVLPVPYEEEKIRNIAKEIEVDEEKYLKAISKIKIIPKKNIEASANLLYVIANSLSQMGYEKYKTLQLSNELAEASENIYNAICKVIEIVENAKVQNHKLNENFNELSDTTENTQLHIGKTDEIMKYINEVAKQTKMLGINASIEAAHLGEAGKSFNIISKEIRQLAEISNRQSNHINEILEIVKQCIFSVGSQIGVTTNDIKDNTNIMEEISKYIVEINEIADKLSSLSKQFKKL